ncbi:MAG: lipopolysaccharide heptosyltransferase II [Acidobacteria bacterium]|nr:lipopolysaccharide heptosyltransferase II [Acidobacteriota bacterium]
MAAARGIDPAGIRRILIRGTNWVGDAVMSVPAMREIRRLFPGAHIALLVRPWVRDVYAAADFVDSLLEYDKAGRHQGIHGLLRLSREIRGGRFDLAVLLQNAFEAALLAWLAGIPRRTGYARDARGIFLTHPCRIDPEVRRVHQAYYYLDILAGAGLLDRRLWNLAEYRPDATLGVRDSDRIAAWELLRQHGVSPEELIVGMNPGAFYGGAKRWLLDRYARAGDELAERFGARILILGSTGEIELAREIAGNMRQRPVILAGETTLGVLMAAIAACRLLITNDSGPMHLAAALGTPQVAIFGSTSNIATGPLSQEAEVVREPVHCSPCFLRECPIDFRCMTRITVERVVGAASRKLEKGLQTVS